MTTHYAPATAIAPPPVSIRPLALLLALWAHTMHAVLATWSARAARLRDADSFDQLDERALRDIGADRLITEHHLRRERNEMQWRIDSQFRG